MLGVAIPEVQAKPGKDLRGIAIIVNGYKIKFPDTEPYINTDGRTMVPVRFVSEKLGASVKWEEASQTVILKYADKEIQMKVGSKEVRVNGETIALDTAAEKHEGRTMVPLRFVSEVLDSTVEWDANAHSVRVTDAEYQAKIDSKKVALDPWGREYSKTWDQYWMKLSDMEPTGFYEFYPISANKKYVQETIDWDFKSFGDEWAEHIQKYYAQHLNIDYRTISEKAFIENHIEHTNHNSSFWESVARDRVKDYLKWVKKNKIIVKGYAFPEVSQVENAYDGRIAITVNFKFKVISAVDPSIVFMDNWNVGSGVSYYKFKENVWYDGYSRIVMDTNYGNFKYKTYKLADTMGMFGMSDHFYNELK